MDGWEWVESEAGTALLQVLASTQPPTPASIARARKLADKERVEGALDLLDARRRGAKKFPRASELFLDRLGVEQATSIDVARWKAERFTAAGATEVVDLCAGVGGDAFGFALAGIVPTLVDLDEHRLAGAVRNVERLTGQRPPTLVADVAEHPARDLPFHLDPDRRPGRSRTWSFEQLMPGPDVIRERIAFGAPGAIKLGPGVSFDGLPEGEIEIVQRGRGLVQAILWTGPLARADRTVTLFPGDPIDASPTATWSAAPAPLPIAPLEEGGMLVRIEPAIERAGLLGALAAEHELDAPHEHAGFLGGSPAKSSPWFTTERVLAALPGRLTDVERWVRRSGVHVTEVRVRGGDDGPRWETSLRKKSDRSGERAHVWVTRDGEKRRAWITAPDSAE